MIEEEPQYICLNYCMYDQETGYCLTCGRPPLPPPTLDFSQKTFAGISFGGIPAQGTTPLKNDSENSVQDYGIMPARSTPTPETDA